MRTVAAPGRWIWATSGLVTMAVLALPGIHLITAAGQAQNAHPQATMIRTVTMPRPVTSLIVQSYGAPVQITAGPVRRVRVTEIISYDMQSSGSEVAHAVPQAASAGPLSASPAAVQQPGSAGPLSASPASVPPVPPVPPVPGIADSGVPAVVTLVSGGHLSLADPACATFDCSVSFTMITPPGVTATVITNGGPVTVSGLAGANVDSGGGPVTATQIGGPLTVSTEGGPLLVDGLTGSLRATTGGGSASASSIAAATVTVSTDNGDASMSFAAVPDSVTLSTDGGAARLAVPGGPYALTADSDGGPQAVEIATSPAAPRSITVSTGSGSLWIGPSSG